MFPFRVGLQVSWILLVVAGCGEPDRDYGTADLVNVSGTITLDGTPVAAAVVTFESVETGTFSAGMTDADGSYTLRFDSIKMGVTPGRKLVQISTARRIPRISSSVEADTGDPADVGEEGAIGRDDRLLEQIPSCYHSESRMTVNVTGSTTRFDFDLKSDCSTTGSK